MDPTIETNNPPDGPSSIKLGDLARMTVDQYDEATRLGVLEDPHVELVNGFMLRKKPKPPEHCSTLDVLAEALRKLIPNAWYIRVGQPIRLPTYDEPEPDLAILRGKPGDYRRRHPGPEEVAMVVEVSESSLRLDRGDKLRAYARAGIAHYWIVNLVDRRIEAYRDPGPDGYGASTTYDRTSHLSFSIGEQDLGAIDVGAILPETESEDEIRAS